MLEMLDRYLDCLNESFKNNVIFFISVIIKSRSFKSGNGCQPVILYDVEINHAEINFPKLILLISSRNKLKCKYVKAILEYQAHINLWSNMHII